MRKSRLSQWFTLEKKMLMRGIASGKHLLLDMYGAEYLSDTDYIEQHLMDGALLCGATVLNTHFHHFGENMGVTGVVLLAESHISIHTWPENKFAAIDLFMCGNCDPEKAIVPLERAFRPEKLDVTCYERGMKNPTTLRQHNVKM